MRHDTLHLAIVGHVDHGKSTVIGRLLLDTLALPRAAMAEVRSISKALGKDAELAFLIDQLKEERDGELTIDTAQRVARWHGRTYVLIDAPGHLEFVKHMLTGASLADAALLVVDVQQGVMEQTRLHARLLRLLGIDQVVVAVNKMDAVQYNQEAFGRVRMEVLDVLMRLDLAPRVIIPISAREGVNILRKHPSLAWNDGPTLLHALGRLVPGTRDAVQPFRFPVQDVYDVDGHIVVVGRVASGTVRQGQRAIVLPSRVEVTIEALKAFQRRKVRGQAGECLGMICSPGVSIRRGDVISERPRLPGVTTHFTGTVFWMAEEPLRVGARAQLRCATQEVPVIVEALSGRVECATLRSIEGRAEALHQHEVGIVTVRAERPVVVEPFRDRNELGRFVIEDAGLVRGVGAVLDAADGSCADEGAISAQDGRRDPMPAAAPHRIR